jgi:hypothetical protein
MSQMSHLGASEQGPDGVRLTGPEVESRPGELTDQELGAISGGGKSKGGGGGAVPIFLGGGLAGGFGGIRFLGFRR